MAFRQIKRSSIGTTSLIIFVMTLTFLNLVVVGGILVGLIAGSYQTFRQNFSGDIIITPTIGQQYIDNSQNLLSLARGSEEISAVSSRYVVGAQVRADLLENPKAGAKPNQISVAVVGIDPVDENSISGISNLLIEGEYLRPNEEGYILVGSGRVDRFSVIEDPNLEPLKNVKVGSKVRVTIGDRSKELIIKGVVKSKEQNIDQRMFIQDSELRKLIGRTDLNVNEIAIKISPTSNSTAVVEALKQRANPDKVRVQTFEQAIPKFLRDIELTFAILGNGIGAIALVVASITVFIVIFINAVTRRKYIGILKAIGINGQAIEISYIIQSLFYAIFGSAIGLLLIYGLIKPYFDLHPINFPFSDGILVAPVASSLIRAGILLLVTIVAGFIPARLIIRQNTLDSILGR